MDITLKRRERTRERVPCKFDAVVNGSVTCVAFDISEGGVYLKTGNEFKTGSVVKLSLPFRGEKLEISARIKYCLNGVGIGLMFIDLDERVKGKIKALIQDITTSN